MSSDEQSIESIVQVLFTQNKVSLVMLTIVIYDYVLTFPREVKYVWSKPWTWVSTLFLVVRYCGIYSAIQESLMGTTFIPGPLTVYSMAVLCLVGLHAIHKRLGSIDGLTAQVAMQLVGTALWSNPYTQDATVSISQVLDYSVCQEGLIVIGPYMKYILIQPTVFYLLLLTLALIPTVKQSITMYNATRRWQPNRYMSLIVKEGVFYVFLNLINNVTLLIGQADAGPLPSAWVIIVTIFGTIIQYPFFPRFVMSIRELYEKDSRGRLEGLDTGFGVTSRVGNNVGQGTMVVSAIAFAEDGNGQGKDDEEIQLESARPASEKKDESCSV